jgi:phosphocarrier protein HPr
MTKQLTIVNKLGLHARPAAQFVKLAAKFKSEIWLEKDDETVNGKSIMGLMMLAAGCGAVLTVTVEGPDEATAMEGIENLIASGFKE